MTPAQGPQQDLIVLVADLSMQKTLEELLKRHLSLRIRAISSLVIPQPNYDTAFLRDCSKTLQSQNRLYRHALAICDRHGCAKEALPREQLEAAMEARLANHWGGRAAAIVIDPELEIWVWADSPHVAQAIGWRGGAPALRAWLQSEGSLPAARAKPINPKAAFRKALRLTKKPPSSSIFQYLAARVTLEGCIDPAFLKLKSTLQRWFPQSLPLP